MEQLRTSRARRKTRFPGIIEDAEFLQVSRFHLYSVLSGERKSPGLLARYKAHKAQQPVEPVLAEMAQ